MSCSECEYCPKTVEEAQYAKEHPDKMCPDAFTEVSHYCGKYDEVNK